MFPTVSQLDSFTDVFGDANEVLDENFSQPLSLPTTCDTPPDNITNGINTNVDICRPAKRTGQHGEFRSVEEIDPKYRCLFTFPYFNLVQSRIIEDALYSDKSLVVCAPTGSGKTVVFEMAILQLLMQMEDEQNIGDFKIIYMAPVKAVCNERLTEWYPKLTKLGLLCIEVTGDTEVDFTQLSPYKVIITTPEKWDMLTRRWRDHRGLVEMIKLFLIDEVHILNDETRGPVLEAVVSRMKTVESAAQSAHRIEQLQLQYQGAEPTLNTPPRIRFVAVSATVSNPEDVADWLGTNEKPAVFHKFGDETRPVKLQRIVEGYACAEGTNTFKFDLILNYKLWPIIQKYYNGKPTLIFCNTRKSVALTAEALSREVTVRFSPEQTAKLSALASTLKNKKLQTLVMSGVGCHHAGLLFEERINIERAFRNRELPILITTTTLAMGVNLPAHLVIVKNTQQYVNGAYQEYSISTVLQMVGRAGRPQFDTEATAVIMTRLQDKPRYQALVGGSEPLQSYLHRRLAENLNSEAALGTVTDVAQCVEWLRSTFLYVRAAKDPKRYLGLPPAAPQQLILKKIEELCVKAMNSLASSGLITMDEASCIESTEAGRLMSMFYMDVETMKNIMKIEGSETLEQLLWLICESHELSDMHLRVDERRCLNLLNRNNKAATIRFPMKGKISTRPMKLNCLIQATLGCLQIPEPALNQEALKVMRTASRVCKCLVRYVTRPELPPQSQNFSAVLNSITLSKCIEAHLWENSPYVSKQLKGIGPTFSTLLASAGVTSFMLLEESHPRDLERIMNKGPPAGNIIRKQVSLLPKYQLTVNPIDARSVFIQLMLLNHAHLSDNMGLLTAGDGHRSYLVVGDSDNRLLLLTQFTDKDFISVYDGTMQYEVKRKLSSEHKILIHCVSSTVVGIDVQADYLFLDLEPHAQRESDSFHYSESNTPRQYAATKQTAITDVYRERKRRNETDITQCKEKKKREYSLTQKLNALKESFSKTSKTIKTDVDKSMEMSNKVIHDILVSRNRCRIPENNQVFNKVTSECPVDLTRDVIDDSNNKIVGNSLNQQVELEYPTVDLTNSAVAKTMEDIIIDDNDDYIDDLQIDNILSKIESEISGNDAVNKHMQKNNAPETTTQMVSNVSYAKPSSEVGKVESKYDNMNTTHLINKSSRSVKDTKRKNLKSNFGFMDLIEKKASTVDNSIERNVDKSADSGFSDAIKSQINKFLQQAQNTTKRTTPGINDLLENTVVEDLPEVFVKRDLPTEANTNFNEYEQEESKLNNDKMYNKSKSPITLRNPAKCENLSNHNLPEVNVKTVQFTTNKESQEHSFNKRFKEPAQESDVYEKMAIYKNLQGNNNPEEYIEIGDNFPTGQIYSNFASNHVARYQYLPEKNEPTTHIDDAPVKSLEPLCMPEAVGADLTRVSESSINKMLNVRPDTPGKTISIDSKKSLEQNTCNKLETEEMKTKEESKICNQYQMIPYMPLTGNLANNQVIHGHNMQWNVVTQNRNLAVKTLHPLNKPSNEILDLTETCEEIVSSFETNKYDKNQVVSDDTGLNEIEQNIMQWNQMDKQDKQAAQLNQSIANKYESEKVANNSAHSAWDKHVPIESLETMTQPNDYNNALMPYHKVETIGGSQSKQPRKFHSFIPYSNRQNEFGQKCQNAFVDTVVNKMMHSYRTENQSGPSNYKPNDTSIIVPTENIRPHQTIRKIEPCKGTDNLITHIRQPDSFLNPSNAVNERAYLPTEEIVVKENKNEHSNNQKQTYFQRFSYSATKVDVCTKKYAPDHELRITRKLKVDLDVTEIIKQDQSNQNERQDADTHKKHDDIRQKQNNKTVKLSENDIIHKSVTFKQNKSNNKITGDTDYVNAEISKNENDIPSNVFKAAIPQNITNYKDAVDINEPNLNENTHARKNSFAIEGKPEYSAANNSIENILQKYSKILVKHERTTPSIDKNNTKADTRSLTKSSENGERKSRKPFKISEINAIDVDLHLSNLTSANISINANSQKEPQAVPIAKRVKSEHGENVESYEVKNSNVTPETVILDMFETKNTNDASKAVNQAMFEPNNINVTPKLNKKSFESPVSVHSLKLDSIEDINDEMFESKDMNDESMFNPKLLLQYFTEGNESTDIIAPPPNFTDNSDNAPVYSPIASQETKDFYNHDDLDNIEDNSNTCPAYLQSSPKEIETWCLSKDEENTYTSPEPSAPWVISQRAHTNLGTRRAKLCQFKFVRKKVFRK